MCANDGNESTDVNCCVVVFVLGTSAVLDAAVSSYLDTPCSAATDACEHVYVYLNLWYPKVFMATEYSIMHRTPFRFPLLLCAWGCYFLYWLAFLDTIAPAIHLW